MRVLVVEDEAALRDQLAGVLSKAGYAVDTAGDGERAEFLGQTEQYDAVVLDLGLPRIDGLTVLRRWRECRRRRPGAGPDRARHLVGQGARASTAAPTTTWPSRSGRGTAGPRARADPPGVGPADSRTAPPAACARPAPARGSASTARRCRLTALEFRVFAYLMHHRDRVVPQAELVEHIYERDDDRDSNTLEVFVARLRRKLGARRDRDRARARLSSGPRRMSAPRSLRAALVSGAALWTVGLFVVAGIVATDALFRFPSFPRMFHSLFVNVPVAAAVAVLCLIGGVLQIRRALAALAGLQRGLSRVHAGEDARVAGTFPREVQPLVDDLNTLLDHRAETVRRALARAGDLADGLKTPLTVIAHEAGRGPIGSADAGLLRQQVERMRRQIDYHLAHARAAASGAAPGASAVVEPAVAALVRTLGQLHADRALRLRVEVSDAAVARVQREDLDEMLGNLLDNACKWGRSTVHVSGGCRDGRVHVTVDDDGPGVPEALRLTVLQRGVRADQAAPGSGLGLAIVADLAELYGGSIVLETSPLGGARAHLELPGAPHVA